MDSLENVVQIAFLGKDLGVVKVVDRIRGALTTLNTNQLQKHLNTAAHKARQTAKEFQSLHKVTTKGVMGDLGLTQLIPKMRKAGNTAKQTRGVFTRFRMEFLSFMFFGMQLQRMFTSLAKSVTSTFKKIMESANIQGTAIQRLGGYWEYLKFVIGSALNRVLGPLMPLITEIIMKVARWVQQNPKLTAGIIALGIAIGALLFFGSQLVLFFNGFMILLKGPVGMAIKGFVTSIGSSGVALSSFLATLGIIAAAIVIAVALWKTNFGGFRDFVTDTFGVLWETVKDVFGDIKDFVVHIWGALMALLSGDFDAFADHLKKAGQSILKAQLKLAVGLAMLFANVFIFMKNLANDVGKLIVTGIVWAVEKAINFVIAKLNYLIGLYNRVMGVLGGNTISTVGNVDFSGARDTISAMMDKNKTDYLGRDEYNKASKMIDIVINVDAMGDPRAIAEKVAQVINQEVAKN